MFTGIIEKIGSVKISSEALPNAGATQADQLVLAVETGFPDLVLGESVAVNGVCLTVARLHADGKADFFVSPETLSRTSLGARSLSKVNLERALPAGGRLSGHIVQGHVDGLARLISVRALGESWELIFDLPKNLGSYCVEKGSIALNGVSLTLNRIEDHAEGTRAWLMLIPHTWEHTTFSTLKDGDFVNVEVDILSKYMERLCQTYLSRSSS